MTSPQTRIYLISGLGADESAFENLDFKSQPTTYLPWLKPKNENESIQSYAARMAEKITDENPILLGLSFGGMISMEIAKIVQAKKVILISSAKSRAELPPYFRWFSKTRAVGMLNARTLLWPKEFVVFMLGARSKKDREVVRKFIENSDAEYISWAVKSILKWQNKDVPANCFHIHGSGDAVLPSKFVKADAIVKRGRHLMIRDRSEDVNEILRKIL